MLETEIPDSRGGAVLGRPESEDLMLARLLATAIVELAENPEPAMFKLPYPASAQRAVDLLGARALRRGTKAPTSVPDLVRWCQRVPLTEWDLDLPDSGVTDADLLIDPVTLTPSQLCYEWMVDAPDATADLIEQDLLLDAIATCRDRNLPQSYVAFRRLLIEQPVIDQMAWMKIAADPHLAPLLELIRASYQPIPAAYVREDKIVTCARCRCPLVPTLDDGWACELDRCRWEGLKVGRQIPAGHELHVALRPLRMFITGPGRAETELEAAMTRLGLQVEMWPNIDTYDLRISFPSGRIWAVDVKDRASPSILARTATALRPNPPYTDAFYVVPDYRKAQREDYGRVFRAVSQAARDGEIKFAFTKDLIKAARREARRA